MNTVQYENNTEYGSSANGTHVEIGNCPGPWLEGMACSDPDVEDDWDDYAARWNSIKIASSNPVGGNRKEQRVCRAAGTVDFGDEVRALAEVELR